MLLEPTGHAFEFQEERLDAEMCMTIKVSQPGSTRVGVSKSISIASTKASRFWFG